MGKAKKFHRRKNYSACSHATSAVILSDLAKAKSAKFPQGGMIHTVAGSRVDNPVFLVQPSFSLWHWAILSMWGSHAKKKREGCLGYKISKLPCVGENICISINPLQTPGSELLHSPTLEGEVNMNVVVLYGLQVTLKCHLEATLAWPDLSLLLWCVNKCQMGRQDDVATFDIRAKGLCGKATVAQKVTRSFYSTSWMICMLPGRQCWNISHVTKA